MDLYVQPCASGLGRACHEPCEGRCPTLRRDDGFQTALAGLLGDVKALLSGADVPGRKIDLIAYLPGGCGSGVAGNLVDRFEGCGPAAVIV